MATACGHCSSPPVTTLRKGHTTIRERLLDLLDNLYAGGGGLEVRAVERGGVRSDHPHDIRPLARRYTPTELPPEDLLQDHVFSAGEPHGADSRRQNHLACTLLFLPGERGRLGDKVALAIKMSTLYIECRSITLKDER